MRIQPRALIVGSHRAAVDRDDRARRPSVAWMETKSVRSGKGTRTKRSPSVVT